MKGGVPFFEVCRPGVMMRANAPPHVRVWRIVYTRYLDWHIIAPSKVRYLFWRFWFVKP